MWRNCNKNDDNIMVAEPEVSTPLADLLTPGTGLGLQLVLSNPHPMSLRCTFIVIFF